nr:hypothetical protein [Xenococcaceae cyanobacterium MO_188.B29]
MNLCNYLKSFFYQTTTINDSNLDNLIVEKIDNKVDYVVDSQKIDNKVKYKSCFQKIKTIIKWSLLHSLRNNISNSNPEKRLSLLIYLLSWFFVVFGLLFTCLVYFPSFCEIATGLIAASIIFDKLFLEIKINRQSISKYIFSILMFIFTYYLFIKFYRESLLNNLSHNLDIELLISIVCLVIFSFSIGFMMEAYFFWKKNRAKLNIIIGTLAAFISFFSLYFGRCIFVEATGVEPSILSRPVIIFSVPIGI